MAITRNLFKGKFSGRVLAGQIWRSRHWNFKLKIPSSRLPASEDRKAD